jgi:methylphosphotriester-DNA--protein-cysteine methyltransferase
MERHTDLASRIIFQKIKGKQFNFAGNMRLKIFGTLSCKSGKRMNRKNRVFFFNEHEAIRAGFRPCGHCMREAYLKWKQRKKRVG